MPPKPGGPKRVGGGAKRGGGAAKAGAKGGKGGAGKAKGSVRAGGPIAVNARNMHLSGNGSTMDLIRPVSNNLLGNQFVREEYRRNSGHVQGTSSAAMSALGQHGTGAPPQASKNTEYGRQRSYSAATRTVSEFGKSMTNLFLSSEERPSANISKFDGSSLNLSKNPSTNSSTNKQPARQTSTTKTASGLGKSLTNLLDQLVSAPTDNKNDDKIHVAKFSGSSINLTSSNTDLHGSPVKLNASSIKSNLLGVTSNMFGIRLGSKTNLNRSTGCLNLSTIGIDHVASSTDLRRSNSNVEISLTEEILPKPAYIRQKTFPGSNLSPIESMGSITSSKQNKNGQEGLNKFLPSRLQNTIGGTALTSATPTALSSHMDPRMLQAVSGIAGAGFVASQMPNHEEGAELPDSPDKFIDPSTGVLHPEQLNEGTGDGEDERVPSDLMRATMIDGSEATLPVSPQLTAPPIAAPFSADPLGPQAAPAYHVTDPNCNPYHGDYGENLYTKSQSYDPQEHYHLSTPLLENKDPALQPGSFPVYQQHHVGYHYYSQNPDPMKYNYATALQNYGNVRASHNDGMYCYSCVMFLGVLLIGIGIILIIVKLFRLFGKDIPLAIIGGGLLLIGILTLASAMLAWRRKRTSIKKKQAHV